MADSDDLETERKRPRKNPTPQKLERPFELPLQVVQIKEEGPDTYETNGGKSGAPSGMNPDIAPNLDRKENNSGNALQQSVAGGMLEIADCQSSMTLKSTEVNLSSKVKDDQVQWDKEDKAKFQHRFHEQSCDDSGVSEKKDLPKSDGGKRRNLRLQNRYKKVDASVTSGMAKKLTTKKLSPRAARIVRTCKAGTSTLAVEECNKTRGRAHGKYQVATRKQSSPKLKMTFPRPTRTSEMRTRNRNKLGQQKNFSTTLKTLRTNPTAGDQKESSKLRKSKICSGFADKASQHKAVKAEWKWKSPRKGLQKKIDVRTWKHSQEITVVKKPRGRPRKRPKETVVEEAEEDTANLSAGVNARSLATVGTNPEVAVGEMDKEEQCVEGDLGLQTESTKSNREPASERNIFKALTDESKSSEIVQDINEDGPVMAEDPQTNSDETLTDPAAKEKAGGDRDVKTTTQEVVQDQRDDGKLPESKELDALENTEKMTVTCTTKKTVHEGNSSNLLASPVASRSCSGDATMDSLRLLAETLSSLNKDSSRLTTTIHQKRQTTPKKRRLCDFGHRKGKGKKRFAHGDEFETTPTSSRNASPSKRTKWKGGPTPKKKRVESREEKVRQWSDSGGSDDGLDDTDLGLRIVGSDSEAEFFDEAVEQKAKKNNLTAINVKNILHQVITNEHVLEMVRNTIQEEEAGQTSEAHFEPKMTRAKIKEVMSQGNIPHPWPITPIKTQPGVPTPKKQQFLEMTFSDTEEEDEEYSPEHDDPAKDSDEDTESILSSRASDLGSPAPSTPCTPSSLSNLSGFMSSQTSTPKTADPQTPTTSHPMGPPLSKVKTLGQRYKDAISGVDKRLSSTSPIEEEETIALRTRSRLPLNDTPIDVIESNFVAPDITEDMYDTYCDDQEWQGFLAGLVKTTEAPELNDTAEDDNNDPEYNFLAEAENEEVDQEDLRTDRAVRITKKELNKLMDELFEGEDISELQDEEYLQDIPPAKPSFMQPQPIRWTRCMQAAVVRDLLKNKPKGPLLLQTVDVQESTPSRNDFILTESESVQLEDQMRKHTQLLLTTCIMATGNADFKPVLDLCTLYLNELQNLSAMQISQGKKSAFLACNLQEAVDTVKTIGSLPYQTAESLEVDKIKYKPRRGCANYCQPSLPVEKIDLFISKKVFIFPQMLPEGSFLPLEQSNKMKVMFTEAEDNLLALGLAQFSHFQQCEKKIHDYIMPPKTEEQIKIRMKNLRAAKAADNAVKFFKEHRCVPDFHRYTVLMPESQIIEPRYQDQSLMPSWWPQLYYDMKETKATGGLKKAPATAGKPVCAKKPRELKSKPDKVDAIGTAVNSPTLLRHLKQPTPNNSPCHEAASGLSRSSTPVPEVSTPPATPIQNQSPQEQLEVKTNKEKEKVASFNKMMKEVKRKIPNKLGASGLHNFNMVSEDTTKNAPRRRKGSTKTMESSPSQKLTNITCLVERPRSSSPVVIFSPEDLQQFGAQVITPMADTIAPVTLAEKAGVISAATTNSKTSAASSRQSGPVPLLPKLPTTPITLGGAVPTLLTGGGVSAAPSPMTVISGKVPVQNLSTGSTQTIVQCPNNNIIIQTPGATAGSQGAGHQIITIVPSGGGVSAAQNAVTVITGGPHVASSTSAGLNIPAQPNIIVLGSGSSPMSLAPAASKPNIPVTKSGSTLISKPASRSPCKSQTTKFKDTPIAPKVARVVSPTSLTACTTPMSSPADVSVTLAQTASGVGSPALTPIPVSVASPVALPVELPENVATTPALPSRLTGPDPDMSTVPSPNAGPANRTDESTSVPGSPMRETVPPGLNVTASPGNIIKKAFVRAMSCLEDSSSLPGLSDLGHGATLSSPSRYVTAAVTATTSATTSIKMALSSPGLAEESTSKVSTHGTSDLEALKLKPPDHEIANLEPVPNEEEESVVVEGQTSLERTRLQKVCESENPNLEPRVSLSASPAALGSEAWEAKKGEETDVTAAGLVSIASPAAFEIVCTHQGTPKSSQQKHCTSDAMVSQETDAGAHSPSKSSDLDTHGNKNDGNPGNSAEVSTGTFSVSTPKSKLCSDQLDLSVISEGSLGLTPQKQIAEDHGTTLESIDMTCSDCLSDSLLDTPVKQPPSGADSLNTPQKLPGSGEEPELTKSGQLKQCGPDSSSPSQQAAKSALDIMAVVAGYISTPTKASSGSPPSSNAIPCQGRPVSDRKKTSPLRLKHRRRLVLSPEKSPGKPQIKRILPKPLKEEGSKKDAVSPFLEKSPKKSPQRKILKQQAKAILPKGFVISTYVSPTKKAAASLTAKAKRVGSNSGRSSCMQLRPRFGTPRPIRPRKVPVRPRAVSPGGRSLPDDGDSNDMLPTETDFTSENDTMDSEYVSDENDTADDKENKSFSLPTERSKSHDKRSRRRKRRKLDTAMSDDNDTQSENEDSNSNSNFPTIDECESQNEDDLDVPEDDDSHLEELMRASTTVRFVPKRSQSHSEYRKTKARQRREMQLSMLASNIVEDDPLRDERDSAFAQAYLTKVKDTLKDQKEQYEAFLRLLFEFGESERTPVELYDDMQELLSDHPQLLQDFAGFLLPDQARACGCFMENLEFCRARTFLRKLEVHFAKHPATFHKILKAFTGWQGKSDKDPTELKEVVRPLLRGQQHLLDEFSKFFVDERPPESHMTDFEEIRLGDDDDEDSGTFDGFEEAELPEGDDELYGTQWCKCQCHNTHKQRWAKRKKHCMSCGMKIIQGHMYMQTTEKCLRPIRIVYREQGNQHVEAGYSYDGDADEDLEVSMDLNFETNFSTNSSETRGSPTGRKPKKPKSKSPVCEKLKKSDSLVMVDADTESISVKEEQPESTERDDVVYSTTKEEEGDYKTTNEIIVEDVTANEEVDHKTTDEDKADHITTNEGGDESATTNGNGIECDTTSEIKEEDVRNSSQDQRNTEENTTEHDEKRQTSDDEVHLETVTDIRDGSGEVPKETQTASASATSSIVANGRDGSPRMDHVSSRTRSSAAGRQRQAELEENEAIVHSARGDVETIDITSGESDSHQCIQVKGDLDTDTKEENEPEEHEKDGNNIDKDTVDESELSKSTKFTTDMDREPGLDRDLSDRINNENNCGQDIKDENDLDNHAKVQNDLVQINTCAKELVQHTIKDGANEFDAAQRTVAIDGACTDREELTKSDGSYLTVSDVSTGKLTETVSVVTLDIMTEKSLDDVQVEAGTCMEKAAVSVPSGGSSEMTEEILLKVNVKVNPVKNVISPDISVASAKEEPRMEVESLKESVYNVVEDPDSIGGTDTNHSGKTPSKHSCSSGDEVLPETKMLGHLVTTVESSRESKVDTCAVESSHSRDKVDSPGSPVQTHEASLSDANLSVKLFEKAVAHGVSDTDGNIKRDLKIEASLPVTSQECADRDGSQVSCDVAGDLLQVDSKTASEDSSQTVATSPGENMNTSHDVTSINFENDTTGQEVHIVGTTRVEKQPVNTSQVKHLSSNAVRDGCGGVVEAESMKAVDDISQDNRDATHNLDTAEEYGHIKDLDVSQDSAHGEESSQGTTQSEMDTTGESRSDISTGTEDSHDSSWTREEDREVLQACKLQGPGESTFRQIADKLQNRTTQQVTGRFHTLMSILTAAQDESDAGETEDSDVEES